MRLNAPARGYPTLTIAKMKQFEPWEEKRNTLMTWTKIKQNDVHVCDDVRDI